MRFKSILAASAILSLSVSFSSMAHKSSDAHPAPNFDYVQAGFTQLGDGEDKLDGFHVEGSYSLSDTVFVRGEYQDASDTIMGVDFNVDITSLAVGHKASVNPNTSYYMAVSYEELGASADGFSNSEDGFGAYVGVKSFLNPKVELYGELSYLNIHDADISEIGYELGGHYYFTKKWSTGLSYRKIDDLSLVNLGLRYSF